jgi:hypothetical protein
MEFSTGMKRIFSTKALYSLLAAIFFGTAAFGQTAQIILGPDEIGENQLWTITITVQNGRLQSYDNFPEISGFKKRGTSSQSQTSVVNGQVSSSQSIIMTYLPLKQGTYTVPPFKMNINDQLISSPGKKVKVGPPTQSQQSDPFRSFFERDNFFGRSDTEFVEVKDDAFLAIMTDKDEVYVGEGFNATLSFIVSDANRAPMQFHKLSDQLTAILKKIKPGNCWEENFNIENIEGETITIGGKYYTQYKLYQATFYPLNTQPIEFPSVGLEMLKFKVAKNPSYFGQNRQEDYKTFYSKPKKVKVKELPPHPLRDQVAVGDYKLEENIGSTALNTGQSFAYDFRVYGEGNISAIEKPVLFKDGTFDFYEPNIRQDINRQDSRVTGTKSFSYFIIPKEPGDYRLSEYFQFVFFNPAKARYDTLKPQASITVSGESLKNEAIESTDGGTFYDAINTADNTLTSRAGLPWLTVVLNIFILVVLAGSVYLVLKK